MKVANWLQRCGRLSRGCKKGLFDQIRLVLQLILRQSMVDELVGVNFHYLKAMILLVIRC